MPVAKYEKDTVQNAMPEVAFAAAMSVE